MVQPFRIDDLYLHQRVTDLQFAPGDALVVGRVQSVDREQDKAVSCLWAFALDGSGPRQLTHGPGLDKTPRWSPDGERLAFISDRGGSAQVYVLPADGGEALALAQLPGAVADIVWMPDGKSLLVTAAVPVDPDWRGERAQGRKPTRRQAQPEVCWKLPYKSDGSGFILSREIHLFLLDAGGGAPKQLTDGPFDVLGADPSPNGHHIAFVRTRQGRLAHRTDLWVADTDGSHPRQLTDGFATVSSPRWTPDGRRIAFSASAQEGDAQYNLWCMEFATRDLQRIGDADLVLDDPDSTEWLGPDELVFTQQFRGRSRVVRATCEGRVDVIVDGDRQIESLAVGEDHLAFEVAHPSVASEVTVCKLDGGGERQVSNLNPWWKERTPIEAQVRRFEVPDGKGGMETIEGWLIRAKGTQGPTPLLDDVHGGPASHVLLDYESNTYWQALCSKGWSVLALNAVGSSGFGREFCERLSGHWGEMDLPQHIEAIRQLVACGDADERQAIAGKSYGGYLAGWAIGHCEQFRAAVVMAPVGNVETHYGTSDGGYYADPYYMGTDGKFDRKLAYDLSPLKHVERAKTPTLFMQGKDDERCPKCQSEELFVSMMAAGNTPAELVMYAGEGHSFLASGTPSVREDAADRVLDWLERFGKSKAAQR